MHEDLLRELYGVIPHPEQSLEGTPRPAMTKPGRRRWRSEDISPFTSAKFATPKSKRRSLDVYRDSSQGLGLHHTTKTALAVAKIFDKFVTSFLHSPVVLFVDRAF